MDLLSASINTVAELISKIIPEFCGVTLGGSSSHGLNDSCSDVEMYFYSLNGIPTEKNIERSLLSIGATHKRCSSFLWNKSPWGPHSFFVYNGIYFEIGYRIVSDIECRINDYQNGSVSPLKDCNDLGLGYMPSGLANSVSNEKIIIEKDTCLTKMRNKAKHFPKSLLTIIEQEYIQTAQYLFEHKLNVAVERLDISFYQCLSARIVRCLYIYAFALNSVHFPGDKWNEQLLLETKWDKAPAFCEHVRNHSFATSLTKKRNELVILFELVGVIYE